MQIGIDTGGTFTDVVGLDSDGQIHVIKTPSTPDNPARAILRGVASMIENARVS